jgi:hypothetical protein
MRYLIVVLLAIGPSGALAAETSNIMVTQVCAMIYAPVCGRDKHGVERTYSNACVARAAGVVRFSEGPCRPPRK